MINDNKVGKEINNYYSGTIKLNPRKCISCKQTTLFVHCQRIYYNATSIEEGLSEDYNYINFWLCKNCGKRFEYWTENSTELECLKCNTKFGNFDIRKKTQALPICEDCYIKMKK